LHATKWESFSDTKIEDVDATRWKSKNGLLLKVARQRLKKS